MKSNVYFSHFSIHIASYASYSDFISLGERLIELKNKLSNDMRTVLFCSDFLYSGNNNILNQMEKSIANNDPTLLSALNAYFYNKVIGSNLSCDDHNISTNIINSNKYEEGNVYSYAYCLDETLSWPNVETNLLLYSIDDIYNFDCKILRTYPLSNKSFINRAMSIFNKLYFSSNCPDSLGSLNGRKNITHFSNSFVKALLVFQEVEPIIRKSNNNKEDLELIGSKSGMACTPEGGKNKDYLDFEFIIEGVNYCVNCEYHLKPHKANQQGDNTYYQNRIYFGLRIIDGVKKICIAHMGAHL